MSPGRRRTRKLRRYSASYFFRVSFLPQLSSRAAALLNPTRLNPAQPEPRETPRRRVLIIPRTALPVKRRRHSFRLKLSSSDSVRLIIRRTPPPPPPPLLCRLGRQSSLLLTSVCVESSGGVFLRPAERMLLHGHCVTRTGGKKESAGAGRERGRGKK